MQKQQQKMHTRQFINSNTSLNLLLCSNTNVIENFSMNKFKGRTVTLGKLIIITLICALFIYLLQLVDIHSVHCVLQIIRMPQTIFRKCLHSMNSGTTKDRSYSPPAKFLCLLQDLQCFHEKSCSKNSSVTPQH